VSAVEKILPEIERIELRAFKRDGRGVVVCKVFLQYDFAGSKAALHSSYQDFSPSSKA
jgi:hypothetical protein